MEWRGGELEERRDWQVTGNRRYWKILEKRKGMRKGKGMGRRWWIVECRGGEKEGGRQKGLGGEGE